MSEHNTLYGEDATVSRVLDKIELAARRAVGKMYPDGTPAYSLMQTFAEELLKIKRDVGK